MSTILNFASSLAFKGFSSVYSVSVRNASKKASGACRNRKQAKGPRWSIKVHDGAHIYSNDLIATQGRLRYHPGMNVELVPGKNYRLRALKEGTVRFTCEKADLDFSNKFNQKFYNPVNDAHLYKKYAHVIPKPEHNRFKAIKNI